MEVKPLTGLQESEKILLTKFVLLEPELLMLSVRALLYELVVPACCVLPKYEVAQLLP